MRKNGSYYGLEDQTDRALHTEQEESHVPLHRSYGVTRRHRPLLERLGTGALSAVALWVMSLLGLTFFLALITFFLYGQLLIVTLLYVIFGTVFAFCSTKTLRRRLKFRRQLKTLCRKQGYRLEYKRTLFSSFFWSPREIDFVLRTKTKRYEVRFLTLRKYNSALFFESGETLRQVSYPLRNPFTVIFGIKPKTRLYPLDGRSSFSRGSGETVRALLVNPVCKEMYYKDRDGATVATGSGAELFGYTVFTATGFLETVKRNDNLS